MDRGVMGMEDESGEVRMIWMLYTGQMNECRNV